MIALLGWSMMSILVVSMGRSARYSWSAICGAMAVIVIGVALVTRGVQ